MKVSDFLGRNARLLRIRLFNHSLVLQTLRFNYYEEKDFCFRTWYDSIESDFRLFAFKLFGADTFRCSLRLHPVFSWKEYDAKVLARVLEDTNRIVQDFRKYDESTRIESTKKNS